MGRQGRNEANPGAVMGEVRTFEVVSGGHGPLPELVETLEGLLEDARAGRLHGLAYCTVREGGEIGTGWDGGHGTRFPLGAAVSILSVRYASAMGARE